MNMKSFEQMIQQLQVMWKQVTGQQDQWQECRQYCPVKPERPLRRQTRSSEYYQ